MNRNGYWKVSVGAILGLLVARGAGQESEPTGGAILRAEAQRLAPLFRSSLAKDFLAAAEQLNQVPPRVIYRGKEQGTYLSPHEYQLLSATEQARYDQIDVDESLYYTTKYGSPLAYARPIEILGERHWNQWDGRKILDFGYGTIGHLKLMAHCGAEAVGVDVDPFLTALYSAAADQGPVQRGGEMPGHVRLVRGRFPSEAECLESIGGGYDLFLSKNTLKRGYVHPEREVNPRHLLGLGVSDEAFVKSIARILKPNGLVLIYNICPAPTPPDQPYVPWSDGHSPFTRETWETAGFQVLAFDAVENVAVRQMAQALGWDKGEGAMDLESDLFAMYSLFQRTMERDE